MAEKPEIIFHQKGGFKMIAHIRN